MGASGLNLGQIHDRSTTRLHRERASGDDVTLDFNAHIRGPGDRPQPDRSRPSRLQAPPHHRCQGRPARSPADRGKHPRQPPVRRADRCRAANPPWRRPTAAATGQAPCRQGLRLPALPQNAAPACHPAAYCAARHRQFGTLGTASLGHRTHARLVQPLPAADCPIRATHRHLRGLPPSRRRPHLLALRPAVLLGVLILQLSLSS
jgi:hypothetical protein